MARWSVMDVQLYHSPSPVVKLSIFAFSASGLTMLAISAGWVRQRQVPGSHGEGGGTVEGQREVGQ